jgi:pimeloyl-ACP methyl ester carboxylesterase
MIPAPGGTVSLASGRRLSFDDAGDPSGRPVFFLHGCPGSRLSRHPDDAIAGRAGVRLISVDRPGYGNSDADPASDEVTQADDVVALADHLGVDRFAVIAWSSGGPTALALAAEHPNRIGAVAIAAGQPELLADPGAQSPAAFARMSSEFVAAPGISYELAMEAAVEGWDDASLAELTSVDGAHERLALSLAAAVEHGLSGVEGDLRAMATPWRFDLASISVPVVLWYGTKDPIYPPDVGRALAARIPSARLEIVDGATHLVVYTHWMKLLDCVAQQLDLEEPSCP